MNFKLFSNDLNIKTKKSIYQSLACFLGLVLLLLVPLVLCRNDIAVFTLLPLFICCVYFLINKPEILLSLFLMVNLIKEEPHLKFLNAGLDAVIFLWFILFSVIFYKTVKKNFLIPRINSYFLFFVGCFFSVFALSLLYTPAPVYGMDKFIRILFIIGLMIIAPHFLIDSKQKIINFFSALVYICSILVIISIVTAEKSIGFHSIPGTDYLSFGRVLGMSALIIIYYFLLRKDNIFTKLFWIILLLLNLFGLIYSGGRMPVVAFILTIIFTTAINLMPIITKYKNRIIKIGIASMYAVIATILFLPSVGAVFLARMRVFLYENGGGDSFQIRMQLYKDALMAFGENPILGLGIGGFSNFSSGIDQRLYPHNIFLELMSETGIIGLMLFVVLLGICIGQFFLLIKRTKEENYYILTAIYSVSMFFFINSLTSGDISDNRMLFFWISFPFCLNKILLPKGESTLNLV